ncbi:MAG: hypothetical protein HYZ73_08255 [Elusimicrobia bacterium]|nr:hypothetical protein [Elusimicrobiota bacterium]
MPKVYLVTCTEKKSDRRRQAKNLYTSDLFVLTRQLVEYFLRRRKQAEKGLWFILSAEHRLVKPGRVIKPYDLLLSRQSRSYRKQWSEQVCNTLTKEVHRYKWIPSRTPIIIFAGKAYWEFLEPLLNDNGFPVYIPWEEERPRELKGQWKIRNWCLNWLRKRLRQIRENGSSVAKKG